MLKTDCAHTKHHIFTKSVNFYSVTLPTKLLKFIFERIEIDHHILGGFYKIHNTG